MAKFKLEKMICGNLAYDAEFETTPEVDQFLIEAGAKKVLQNAVHAAWEKGLAYPGEAKRPKDFKRENIPFSPESASLLEKLVGLAKVKLGEGESKKEVDLGVADVTNVREYVGADAPEKAYRAEKAFVKLYLESNGGKLASGEARTVATFCGNRGIETPSEPWEEDTEFLAAVYDYNEALREKQRQAALEAASAE